MSRCYCPYCEKDMDDPDDCYETEMAYEEECPHCGKMFIFYVEYEIFYDTHKADCLNGADHNYEETVTFPPELAKLRCTMCDAEKPLEQK